MTKTPILSTIEEPTALNMVIPQVLGITGKDLKTSGTGIGKNAASHQKMNYNK